MSRTRFLRTTLSLLAIAATSTIATAQVAGTARPAPRMPHRHVIVPQSISCGMNYHTPIQVTEIAAAVRIRNQVAETQLTIKLHNSGASREEIELIVPVPDKAVFKSFAFNGPAAEAKAELLTREIARGVYDELVDRLRDPALLEFVGYNVIRTSVFPVEAGGDQIVRLEYETLLTADGSRIDYVLPRSQSLEYSVPWNVSVDVQSDRPLSTVYSPSHEITTQRQSPNHMTISTKPSASNVAGQFQLSYLLEANDITATLMAYPDASIGGGYFLLLAGLPAKPVDADANPVKREITLVLDRSGSMRGEKIEQVRAAALQVVEGLRAGERFNIITYNNAVDQLFAEAQPRSDETLANARAYLANIPADGGTNIHAALTEAMRVKPAENTLPIVLFLTDGLATVGETSEIKIREVATKANPFKRRIFTFGVGVDVNTPLLDKIAYETRAAPTYVLPNENVEVKLSQVFRRLSGPVMSEPALALRDRSADADGRVSDFQPTQLPDLFDGDQLVVLGRYRGDEPLKLALNGKFLGKERTFEFDFALDKASTNNAFVPRLWASRRIADLADAIRQLGADSGLNGTEIALTADPRFRELVDEVVRLSKQFGVLTEYTAFLAREGTNLTANSDVLAAACDNFNDRAVKVRTGWGSVNQSANSTNQKAQACMNLDNGYLDANMNVVSCNTIRQVNDRTFYLRGNCWIDVRLIGDETQKSIRPDQIVRFGTAAFVELMHRLTADRQQACAAVSANVLIQVDGKPVLLVNDPTTAESSDLSEVKLVNDEVAAAVVPQQEGVAQQLDSGNNSQQRIDNNAQQQQQQQSDLTGPPAAQANPTEDPC